MAATFEIDIVHFRPIGSVSPLTVKMTLVGATPDPITGIPTDPSGVALSGSYHIRVPRFVPGSATDPTQRMELKFHLRQDAQFLLQGIAFTDRNAINDLGRGVFSAIRIANADVGIPVPPGAPPRTANRRVLTVTNERNFGAPQSYDYLILVQQMVGTHPGAFGIIDPELENET